MEIEKTKSKGVYELCDTNDVVVGTEFRVTDVWKKSFSKSPAHKIFTSKTNEGTCLTKKE